MPQVRCAMMQKNEVRLLEAWIRYYGYLFGYESLYILDNGSDRAEVFDILRRYERCGVHVITGHTSKEDFDNKGGLIQALAAEWDRRGEQYDLLLPIDCDEFILHADGDTISASRNRIHAHLETLRNSPDALTLDRMFLNDPARPGLFIPETVPKSLYVRGNIGRIDHGFHCPTPANPGAVRRTIDLGYLHLHNKPFRDVLDHAVEKLGHLLDVSDHEALRSYAGPGNHLTSYFFMDEGTFLNRYRSEGAIYVRSVLDLFDGLSIDTATLLGGTPRRIAPTSDHIRVVTAATERSVHLDVFDEAFYRASYPDVARSGFTMLGHFCKHGFREGRLPNGLGEPPVILAL